MTRSLHSYRVHSIDSWKMPLPHSRAAPRRGQQRLIWIKAHSRLSRYVWNRRRTHPSRIAGQLPHTIERARPCRNRGGGGERIPFMQRVLDNPFLLLFLGVVLPTVLYVLWGVLELTSVPHRQLGEGGEDGHPSPQGAHLVE